MNIEIPFYNHNIFIFFLQVNVFGKMGGYRLKCKGPTKFSSDRGHQMHYKRKFACEDCSLYSRRED